MAKGGVSAVARPSGGRVMVLVGAAHFVSHFYMLVLPPLFPLLAQEPSLRDTSSLYVYAPALLGTVVVKTFRTTALYRDTPVWDLALKSFYYAPYLVVAASAWVPWRGRRAQGAVHRAVHRVAVAARRAVRGRHGAAANAVATHASLGHRASHVA